MAIHFKRIFLITALLFAIAFGSACATPNANPNNAASTSTPTANNNATEASARVVETNKRYFLWVSLGEKEVTFDCIVREVRGNWVKCEGSRLPIPGSNEQKRDYPELWLDMNFVVAVLPHKDY